MGQGAAAGAGSDDDDVVVVAHGPLLRSDERDRRGPRPGRASQLGMGQDHCEIPYAVAVQERRVEVLDYEHAVPDVEGLGDLEGPGWVFGGNRSKAPRVTTRECNTPRCHPICQLEAGPRLPGQIRLGLVPSCSPAGVEEEGVAGFGLGYLLRAAEIGDGDDVA